MFSLQKAVCFIMLTCLVPVLFTFYVYTQDVLKLKKKNKIPAPKSYLYVGSSCECIYQGADKSLVRPWNETSYSDQDLWRTGILLFVRHKYWYSFVSLGRCSLFPSRVGLRTYQQLYKTVVDSRQEAVPPCWATG